jgi:hypothetical protein
MIFSAGINQKGAPSELPSSFEIDWVHCYEKVN